MQTIAVICGKTGTVNLFSTVAAVRGRDSCTRISESKVICGLCVGVWVVGLARIGFVTTSSSCAAPVSPRKGCTLMAVGHIAGHDVVAVAIKKRVLVFQIKGVDYSLWREFSAPSVPVFLGVTPASICIGHDKTFTIFDWDSLRPQVGYHSTFTHFLVTPCAYCGLSHIPTK